jgi:hypothetical protein
VLYFYGSGFLGPSPNLTPWYFPEQITSLTLLYIIMNHKPTQPCCFPCLKVLELRYSIIEGRLGCYLNTPNLKELHLIQDTFELLGDASPLDIFLRKSFFDGDFLHGTPALERITLSNMSMDGTFIKGLKSCTLIKTFHFSSCNIDDFIPSFLACLEENDFLPCLTNFLAFDSCSPKVLVSITELLDNRIVK